MLCKVVEKPHKMSLFFDSVLIFNILNWKLGDGESLGNASENTSKILWETPKLFSKYHFELYELIAITVNGSVIERSSCEIYWGYSL